MSEVPRRQIAIGENSWSGNTYDGATAVTVAALSISFEASAVMLRRHEITDQQWDTIKDFLPGKEGDPGATAKEQSFVR